ncbi:MAG: DUF1508 domain-containing protein [bacterium]
MDKFEYYKSSNNEYRWRVSASNGKIIGAASEGYWNKSDCENNAKRILNSTLLVNPVYNW